MSKILKSIAVTIQIDPNTVLVAQPKLRSIRISEVYRIQVVLLAFFHDASLSIAQRPLTTPASWEVPLTESLTQCWRFLWNPSISVISSQAITFSSQTRFQWFICRQSNNRSGFIWLLHWTGDRISLRGQELWFRTGIESAALRLPITHLKYSFSNRKHL